MSLEEEAGKRGTRVPSIRPPTNPWLRGTAVLILLAGLTFVYWVPFQLLGPIAAAFVLAAITVVGASMASQMRDLRLRLDALDAAPTGPVPAPMESEGANPPAPPVPAESVAPDQK